MLNKITIKKFKRMNVQFCAKKHKKAKPKNWEEESQVKRQKIASFISAHLLYLLFYFCGK